MGGKVYRSHHAKYHIGAVDTLNKLLRDWYCEWLMENTTISSECLIPIALHYRSRKS